MPHCSRTVDLEIFVVKYFCGLRKPRKKNKKKNTKYILQQKKSLWSAHYAQFHNAASHSLFCARQLFVLAQLDSYEKASKFDTRRFMANT